MVMGINYDRFEGIILRSNGIGRYSGPRLAALQVIRRFESV